MTASATRSPRLYRGTSRMPPQQRRVRAAAAPSGEAGQQVAGEQHRALERRVGEVPPPRRARMAAVDEEVARGLVADPPEAGRRVVLPMPVRGAAERLAKHAEVVERAHEDEAPPQPR